MMLPESDAKFKNCPFLTTREDKLRFCLGTMCMMWRFRHSKENPDIKEGYCGLAGKPMGAL